RIDLVLEELVALAERHLALQVENRHPVDDSFVDLHRHPSPEPSCSPACSTSKKTQQSTTGFRKESNHSVVWRGLAFPPKRSPAGLAATSREWSRVPCPHGRRPAPPSPLRAPSRSRRTGPG